MNKKANARDVVLLAVTIFALGIIFFVCYYAFNAIGDRLLITPQINATEQAVESIQSVENTSNKLDWVILAVFIGTSLGIIITAYFIGGYPIFMVLYFLLLIVGVVAGMVMSNVWENTSDASVFGDTINHFPITDHLVTNLPVYVAVIGFLGVIAMFVKPQVGGGVDY